MLITNQYQKTTSGKNITLINSVGYQRNGSQKKCFFLPFYGYIHIHMNIYIFFIYSID